MTRFLAVTLGFLAAMLCLPGCADTRLSARREIEAIRETAYLPVGTAYDKAVSDSRGQMVFALHKPSQEIHFYRNGQRINTIGGLGFERTNFQRLADIGVDTDGGLLALDTSQKTLRKFSPSGEAMAELQLKTLQQPELFCLGGDGTLFVYDAATSEIVCFSALDASEMYRFGRFELQQPSSLACNRDYLWVYSSAGDITHVFFLLGQYKEALTGQVVFDSFNNSIRLGDIIPGQAAGQPLLMNVNSDVLTLLGADALRLFRIHYKRDGNAAQ